MGLNNSEIILLIITVIIVVTDVILAICLRFILPYHVTRSDYYAANGAQLEYEDAVEVCNCLKGVFPEKTKEKITFARITTKKLKSKRSVGISGSIIDNYPYLVSLSIPAYVDDPKTIIFACNGLVLTAQTLLTTNSCISGDESEWYALTVRSRSSYWSKYGDIHSVVDVQPTEYQGLVELKIWPEFNEAIVTKLPFSFSSDGNWTYAVSVGWNDEMYEQDPELRIKYGVFDVNKWTSQPSTSQSSKICYNSNSSKVSSKLLITSCNQLLGGATSDGFLKFSPKKNHNEKPNCQFIYRDDGTVKDIEVCQV